MNDVTPELRELMAGVFYVPVEEITETISMGSFSKWDSLQHLNLILSLEDQFNVTFSSDEIASANNFVIVRQLVEEKVAKGSSRP